MIRGPKVSQEQQERIQQQTSDEEQERADRLLASVSPASSEATSASDEQAAQEIDVEVGSARARTGRRRIRRRTKWVDASEVMPKPSFWPLVVAFALAISIFGIMAGSIVLIVGLVLLVVSVIGWALERR
jgi:hypothetical protein